MNDTRRELVRRAVVDANCRIDRVELVDPGHENTYTIERWVCHTTTARFVVELLADPMSVIKDSQLWAVLIRRPGHEPELVAVNRRWSAARAKIRLLIEAATPPSPCPACGSSTMGSSVPANLAGSVCHCGHPRYYDSKIKRPDPI